MKGERGNEKKKTWLQQQQRKIWHFVIGFMDRYRIALWECLQILMDGKWVQTRMEMDAARNWYLVGTPYRGDLEYIRAKDITRA
ncbi:MAG: DUF5348 domain-containing protein [Ruminococcus sp.]